MYHCVYVEYKGYLSTITFFKGELLFFRMWVLLIPFPNPIGSKLPIPSPKKYDIKIQKNLLPFLEKDWSWIFGP